MAIFSLQNDAAQVREQLAQIGIETCSRGAVDHAVVVRQRQWQHQARCELFAVPDRLHRALGQAQDRNFGRIHDRCEMRAANSAKRRDRETN